MICTIHFVASKAFADYVCGDQEYGCTAEVAEFEEELGDRLAEPEPLRDRVQVVRPVPQP